MRKERLEELKAQQEEKEQELAAMGPLRAKMALASEQAKEEYHETDPLLVPFPPLPPLKYLNIEDNGVDMHGKGGKFAPVVCSRLVRRLVGIRCLHNVVCCCNG